MNIEAEVAGSHRQDGFTLIEVVVAVAIMLVAVLGMAATMALGVSVTGQSRQRTQASALAAERLERARNLPYEQVALYEQPVQSSDAGSPDADVTADGFGYRVAGRVESLVVSAGGTVRHIEDPVIRSRTELYVYQYVTWVDDPGISGAQDYKRTTVVVSWRRTLNASAASRLSVSTFIARPTVSVPQVTPVPSAATTPAPSTPTPGSQPGCTGDTTAPEATMSVLSGAGAAAGYTSSASVHVRLSATDECPALTAEVSNDATTWQSVATLAAGTPPVTVTWSLSGPDGTKVVSGRVRDAAGNISAVVEQSITLDRVPPTVPAQLSVSSCSIDGSSRTLTLTWSASSDSSLSGYRLSRSVDDGAYDVVSTTSSTWATDVSSKTSDSVRYVVRAYDDAGNESGDSNVQTFAKNAC